METLYPLLAAVAAYLVGSLSFAVIVSRAMGLNDPRTFGSKNPGATNVLRSGSKAAAIVTVTKTIIKDRYVYVKDTDCALSGGFRVLHDAAAHGVIPQPAAIADAASAPAADVADTVATNYGTCHQIAERLTALQAWVRAQQDLKP